VIVGDLGSDPVDWMPDAIEQLLETDRIQDPQPASDGAAEAAELQAGANATHRGDPATDTADLPDDSATGNLRIDYVLPSDGLQVGDAGVFWPTTTDELTRLVLGDSFDGSDHRLVWVDLH
jgi:hypothetical protein